MKRLSLLIGGLSVAGAATLLVLVLLVFGWLRGPAHVPATEAELAGGWRAADGSGLTLRADHTADLNALPVQLPSEGFDAPEAASPYGAPWIGSASWQLQPRASDSPEHVSILFRKAEFPIDTERSGDKLRLFIYVGDINLDRRFYFDKA